MPEPTVATPVLPLLHTPPVVLSVNVVVWPWHTLMVPPIAVTTGTGLTVTVVLTELLQLPLVTLYVITAVAGLELPVTTPDTVPPLTVAMPVLPLLHTPPVVASVNVVVAPWHTLAVPPIDGTAGNGLTVTIAVTEQPKADV